MASVTAAESPIEMHTKTKDRHYKLAHDHVTERLHVLWSNACFLSHTYVDIRAVQDAYTKAYSQNGHDALARALPATRMNQSYTGDQVACT
jgi:hypothetical protein